MIADPPFDAPQQDANQQVSLISSRLGHRTDHFGRSHYGGTVLFQGSFPFLRPPLKREKLWSQIFAE
jgi:hypothetical protein